MDTAEAIINLEKALDRKYLVEVSRSISAPGRIIRLNLSIGSGYFKGSLLQSSEKGCVLTTLEAPIETTAKMFADGVAPPKQP